MIIPIHQDAVNIFTKHNFTRDINPTSPCLPLCSHQLLTAMIIYNRPVTISTSTIWLDKPPGITFTSMLVLV